MAASISSTRCNKMGSQDTIVRGHHHFHTSCCPLPRLAPYSFLRSSFIAGSRASTAATSSYRGYGLPSLLALNWAAPALRKRIHRRMNVRAAAGFPLVPPSNYWAVWSVVLCIAAFGIWSEMKTEWGYFLTGGLVNTFVGIAASNLGLIATEAPVYSIINQYLLPLSFPLFLLKADLRAVMVSMGCLLLPFCLGSVATILGTFVAMKVVPLHTLGSDGWKIAAALMSRHIGGGANYVAISEALGVSSSVTAAGLAADNLVCVVYFTFFFGLVSRLPNTSSLDVEEVTEVKKGANESQDGPRAYLLQHAAALALSSVVCTLGAHLAHALSIPGGIILCVTVLAVLLTTLCPSWVGSLAPSGETLAILIIQIFFTAGGASTSIGSAFKTSPYLFLFSFVQIAVHLALTLAVGRVLGFEHRMLLVASNANVGGPTTAAGLAIAKGWNFLMVPGILAGIFGVATSSFISQFLGVRVLKFL